jgi:hypothetical protein
LAAEDGDIEFAKVFIDLVLLITSLNLIAALAKHVLAQLTVYHQ